jgi:hypothetical protein
MDPTILDSGSINGDCGMELFEVVSVLLEFKPALATR